MEDISEDDVLVHAKPIVEEFTCAVCFELIRNCASTPCGHSFCKDCLAECLNVKKTCPACNAPVDAKLVLPNKHLDRISQLLQEMKEQAQKDHFARLLQNGNANVDANPKNPAKPAENGIQTVFQRHLMRSLGVYEDYLKKLKASAEASAKEATEEYERKVAAEKKAGGQANVLQHLKAKYQESLAAIQAGFETTEKQLQDSYDSFLKTNLVNPSFLPVQIILVIEATGARYPFVLEPIHTLRDIKKYLLTKPASPNAPELITRISSKKNAFVLRPPFAPSAAGVEGFKAGMDASVSASSSAAGKSKASPLKANADVKIDQKYVPITQTWSVFPGSQLVMLGKPNVNLQTRECFKSTFVANDPSTHTCSFWTCTTCGKDWICKDCTVSCHEGHKLQVYVLDQTWKAPNCYCSKTGQCKLRAVKK